MDRIEEPRDDIKPARSLKEREDQLVLLAIDLAEKQLRDGTASPSVISHYLKLRSAEEQLKLKMLEEKNTLLHAQTEAVKSQQRVEELYSKALEAMREYSGRKGGDV